MNYSLQNEESERLLYRKLKQSDFETWTEMFKTENVATFLGLDRTKSPEELCEIWFKKCFHRYENNLGFMNALIDKKTNKLIGQCGILVQEIEGERRIEIGYSILPKYWKMGYASEASQKCRDFAFENNLANELISLINIDNFGSEKVALNNGMKLEKSMDDYLGMPVNIFKITKAEWKNQN